MAWSLEKQIQADERERAARICTSFWNDGKKAAAKLTLEQILRLDTTTPPDDDLRPLEQAAWLAGHLAGVLEIAQKHLRVRKGAIS